VPVPRFGLFGKFTAVPGRRDALVERLLAAAGVIADAPGCELYLVHTSPDEEDAVWVSEIWRSEADHEASLRMPGAREFIQATMPLIARISQQTRTVPIGGKGLDRPDQ
jgi:quinol monooxygenase YgiN